MAPVHGLGARHGRIRRIGVHGSKTGMDSGAPVLIRFCAAEHGGEGCPAPPRRIDGPSSTARPRSRFRSARGRCGSSSTAASCAGSASASARSCAASTSRCAPRAGPRSRTRSGTSRSEAEPASFRVRFLAHHERGPVRFDWRAEIEGTPDGRIVFAVRGTAGASFLRNRIGLCVLHPAEACAGRRVHRRDRGRRPRRERLPGARLAAPALPQRSRDPARGLARRRGRGADGGGGLRDRGPGQLGRRLLQDLRHAAPPAASRAREERARASSSRSRCRSSASPREPVEQAAATVPGRPSPASATAPSRWW